MKEIIWDGILSIACIIAIWFMSMDFRSIEDRQDNNDIVINEFMEKQYQFDSTMLNTLEDISYMLLGVDTVLQNKIDSLETVINER